MQDTGNPWDDRLSRFPDMGRRIIRVMERMGTLEKVSIDVGHRDREEVLSLVYLICDPKHLLTSN